MSSPRNIVIAQRALWVLFAGTPVLFSHSALKAASAVRLGTTGLQHRDEVLVGASEASPAAKPDEATASPAAKPDEASPAAKPQANPVERELPRGKGTAEDGSFLVSRNEENRRQVTFYEPPRKILKNKASVLCTSFMLGLGRTVTRLCHNPSTANEDVDDPKMNHQNDKVLRLLTASARAELDQAFEERKELNKMEPEEKRFWLKAHTRDHVVFFDGSKDPEGKSEPDEMVRDRKNEMESFAVALLVRELDFVIRAEREKMDDLHTKILRAQAQEEKEKMLLALLHEEKEKRALILLFQVPEVVEMCAKGLLPHLWEFVDPHDTNSNNVKSPKAKANARIAYFLAWGSLNENDPVLQRYAEDHVRPLVERFVNLVAEDEDLQNVVRDVRDKDKDDAISTEQREATENQLLLKPEKSDPCGAEEGVEEKEVSPLFTEKLKEALKPHMGKFFAFAGKFMELGS